MHIARLQADHMTGGENLISDLIWDTLERNPGMKDCFSPPTRDTDYLFESSYSHADKETSCVWCDKKQLIDRKLRDIDKPQVHYWLIASGDQVMKDSITRDRLAQQLGIICFEMEAAGLMNQRPTLVIRGICDYSDPHKQKGWQGYAALTVAAYAKALLSVVPVYRAEWDLTENRKGERHWMVPFGRNTRFVGRQNEINKLEELITMPDGPRKVAITGLGGVGKTQVALELAHRIRDRDQECSIFWVPCTSHEIIEQTLLDIARIIGFHGAKPAEVKEQIKTYLSSKRAGKWLLIFDNADDMDIWLPTSNAVSTLEDFLPQSEQGRILFTSRNRILAVELTSSNLISIPDVDKETAMNILEKLLVQQDLLKDHTAILVLLQQLAFLPLAIAQASAYINKNGLSLSTYVALLQEQESEVVDLLSEDFKDEGRYKDIQNPVITTWLISFKQIQCQNRLAADCLSSMACINPRTISQSLLPLPISRKQGIEALGLLSAYSFITWQKEDRSISIHRLVYIATRSWLRKNALFTYWIRRVADQIHDVFPDDDYTSRGLWREYLPHALSLVHENDFIKQREHYIDLIEKIADCLYSDGRYYEAEVLYNDLIQIKCRKNGPEHPDTLTSMADLASTYTGQGRWKEARELDMQVLETTKLVLGPEHPDTLTSMADLASTYGDQGHWKEAEILEMQVIEIRKTVLGPKHPDTLTSIANLASTYAGQGRWKEAEELEVQVLETRKRVLGPEHPDTLTSIANLASTYTDQGQWKKAEELEVQVLEIRKIVLGSKHPDTLDSMTNLALIFWDQGQLKAAEKLEIQVLEITREVLGPKHPDTLTSMANLAYTWRSLGKQRDALILMTECVKLRNECLGHDHPDSKSSAADLARWRRTRKRRIVRRPFRGVRFS